MMRNNTYSKLDSPYHPTNCTNNFNDVPNINFTYLMRQFCIVKFSFYTVIKTPIKERTHRIPQHMHNPCFEFESTH